MDPTEDVWVFKRSSSRIRKNAETESRAPQQAQKTSRTWSPKQPTTKRRAEVVATPRSTSSAKGMTNSPPRSSRKKKPRTEVLHGPAWYMDWVAKGYTWEEARSGLETETKKPPVKAAPFSKAQQIEYEQRRKIQQVNNEAMQAVRQSDGYVDPADVCRYLIKRSRLDQPYNCLRQAAEDESNAFCFVSSMCHQTIDKEHIYSSVMSEQQEAAVRSKRREENRTRSTPKAIKEQQIRTKHITGVALAAKVCRNPTKAAADDGATKSAISEDDDDADAAIISSGKDEGPSPDGQEESSNSKNYMASVGAPEEDNYSEGDSVKGGQDFLPRRRGLWK